MKRQSGQIGLVVLLMTAVLLTIGVGVASQSVQVQKTTRQETESSETFAAAEDAIEWALSRDLSTDTLESYTNVWTSGIVNLTSSLNYEYSRTISPGQSAQVSLGLNDFVVEWKAGTDCNSTASIVVTTLGVSTLNRYAYRPSLCRSLVDRDFSGVVRAGDVYQITITPGVGHSIARIKVLHAETEITVSGTGLPVQQYQVDATAEKDSAEARSIQVTKDLPAAPFIFDYALYNGAGSITVNH